MYRMLFPVSHEQAEEKALYSFRLRYETMEKVKFYDTTLRDGMQAEGITFSLEDKLAIARRLDELGVDYIEGGYAGSNRKEEQFFVEAARLGLKNSKIAAFGSTRRADVSVADDGSIKAVLDCRTKVATLVGKAWDMQVGDVLGCSLDENLAMCAESIEYLKKQGLEAFFDAEHFYDGYKANPQYAMEVLAAAAEAGADVLVLCDTNGGSLPTEIEKITRAVCKKFPAVEVGIHAHDDTGCATANSLAAVLAGARHVQGTMNGFGERCGNANLCVVMPNLALKMGFDVLSPEKLKTLTEVSLFVFETANISPVSNMPYVGESAFAHKGGLHVDALRKSTRTYEHITPDFVGNERRFLISELSGKSTILAKLDKTQIAQDKELARKILDRVQELENQGYQFEAADASFDLLVKRVMGTYKPAFELIKYHTNVEKLVTGDIVSEATVKLRVGDKVEYVVGEGDGPVNALDAALRKALENFYPSVKAIRLIDYKVRVVNAGAGTAARVRVIIHSRDEHSGWGTVGCSENIIEASWQALADSVDYRLQREIK